MVVADMAGGRNERVRVETGYRNFNRERIALRDIAAADGLVGRVSVAVPEGAGTLTIDGVPAALGNAHDFSGILPAGTHRFEWVDASRICAAGETVELLPFCIKKISLRRFTNE